MVSDDLLGKQFIIPDDMDAEIYTIERARQTPFSNAVVCWDTKGMVYKWDTVIENFEAGQWCLICNDVQVEWIRKVRKRCVLTQSQKIVLKTILKRDLFYYDFKERATLNWLREKYGNVK